MKLYRTLLLPLLFTYALSLCPAFSFAGDHYPGQLIVMLQPDKNIKAFVREHARFNNQSTGIRIAKQLSGTMNIWLLEFNPAINELTILNSIRSDKNTAAAQFNFYLEERATPDDQYFNNQWSMNNTGQSGGTADADIDAKEAWDITKGGITALGDTIVVAIIDCGFDLTQQDIDFWKNNNEIPGNGIDDDGNGYIDDYNGWTAKGNDNIQWCSHGTHVAGIAGAKGNNSIGVAGVNWNVKIMPLDYDSLSDANAVACYAYAFEMRRLYNTTSGAKGAFVVSTNTSFGKNRAKPVDHPVWCAIFDSLGSAGILSAGAGPNIAYDVDTEGDIPTTCPSDWLISVTNTTNKDLLYSSASWGPINIDLGAPGTTIWSTLPGNQYGPLTGTSMATPHVAGAVALMWAAACDNMVVDYKKNPATMAAVMKKIMLDNVDTLPSLQNKTLSGGRLNLYRCLIAVQEYCKTYPPPKPFSYYIYPNPAMSIAYIDIPSTKNTERMVVTDMLGRPVLVRISSIPQTDEYKTVMIDLTGLSPAAYIVSVPDEGNDFLFNRILIVQ